VRRLLLPLLPLLLLAAGALALPAGASAAQHGFCIPDSSSGPRCTIWYGKAEYVDDGDTVHVKVGSRDLHVRVTGIQAMELTDYDQRARSGQCHAVEAADRLDQLISQAHGQVRLAAQNHASTSRKRPLRSIAIKRGRRWVDVGRTLLQEGLVLWMPNRVESAWNPRYAVYVEQAQAARIGLWNTAACGVGPSEGAPMKIWVNWKNDASDPGDPDGEWVRIRNLDPVNPLPLGGWWVRDSGLREYRFPASAVVPAGGLVTLYVGGGFDDDTDFYWGLETPVFDNVDRAAEMGDGAYLFDPQGDMRAWMTYPCRTTCADPNANAFQVVVHPRGKEWVGVRNVSVGPVGLEGYRLTAHGHVYAFDSDAVLQPGQLLKVYTTRDLDLDRPLTNGWGEFDPILPNGGGAARLSTFTDSVLACAAWGDGTCSQPQNP
jgi:endonuclease YncB( thermonuclease family)